MIGCRVSGNDFAWPRVSRPQEIIARNLTANHRAAPRKQLVPADYSSPSFVLTCFTDCKTHDPVLLHHFHCFPHDLTRLLVCYRLPNSQHPHVVAHSVSEVQQGFSGSYEYFCTSVSCFSFIFVLTCTDLSTHRLHPPQIARRLVQALLCGSIRWPRHCGLTLTSASSYLGEFSIASLGFNVC